MDAFLFLITSSVLVYDCVKSSMVFGRVGETITLPCKYDIDRHGILNICWGRHQSWLTCKNTLISTDGLEVDYRETHRFSLAGRLDQGDVSLTIKGVKEKDAGLYVCRIEVPGLFNDASNTVFLFISIKLDPKRVTQSAPTIVKLEKQVYSVFDPIRLTTEEYIRSETRNAADVTDIHIGKSIAVVQTEETIETFVINAVRLGAIVFIPGLIIIFLFMCKCDVLVQHFEGERATLPCKYDSRYHGKLHICWMKGEIPNMGCGDEIIASDGDKVVRRMSNRYQLTGDIHHGDVSLTISNIQKKDSGKYGCRIHIPGWFNDETYNVNLIVKDAPTPTTQETVSVPSITSERQTTAFTSDMTEAPVSTTPEPVAVTTIPGSITTIPGSITTLPGSITTMPGSITTESQSTHTTTDIDTTKESSTIFGSSESSTTGLWPSNTTHDNVVDYHEQSLVVNKKSVNTSAIIVPVLLLLLCVIGIAVILTWKQKRKCRAVAEIAQNSENAVIYNNSGSTVGLYSREMAVNNIYQMEPESEYEQWH